MADGAQARNRGTILRPGTLQRLREYIESNLDSTLTLQAMSTLADVSLAHFARCFRNSTGITPHAYVMQRRLQRARELIATTSLSMTEIALRSGFADQSHFTRRFRSRMGCTPHVYRLMHRRHATTPAPSAAALSGTCQGDVA